MDLILCHTTADFDTLGAAVGLARLRPGSRIVLAGGAHPAVRDFLALYRDEYPLIERRSVPGDQIRSISIVDTQSRDRLGKTAEWLDLPVPIAIYDHHPQADCDIPAQETIVEDLGATTTLITEQLQQEGYVLNALDATVLALGIHVDTGSLTFDHTTPRDAAALTWLMTQGASLPVISEYLEPGLSPQLQVLLGEALERLQTEGIQGYTLAWVLLETAEFVPGLSTLISHLVDLTDVDGILLAHRYGCAEDPIEASCGKMSVIGRSRIKGTDLNQLFKPWGGGGHAKAAALNLREGDYPQILEQLLVELRAQIPPAPTARELMSSPVRTILPETTIAEAQRILLRYGHSGLSVMDDAGQLIGVISRRDLDIAFHHGFSHAKVKGYMTTNLHTIAPETTLPAIEELMVTYDIGRLPVLEQGKLVGIVTRTDVLRQLHRQDQDRQDPRSPRSEGHARRSITVVPPRHAVVPSLNKLIDPLKAILSIAAQQAEERGWHLYLVGGGVRDLMLSAVGQPVMLTDLDLVVDGYHRSAEAGAGVELAKALQALYPEAKLEVHGKFQTAALTWHKDPVLDSLWIDIATARTEFYPYPAANPEVEASSIQQDLYRRDFTINALALRLTNPRSGEMLDFFGGVLDLRAKCVRVLHPNSFIEDPTRIYRGVRFAARLGFDFDAQTEGYIRHAIASGIYNQVRETQNGKVIAPALQTRLKAELKYILQAKYWRLAVRKLAELDALCCIYPTLKLTTQLWRQLRLMEWWMQQCNQEGHLQSWQMLLEVLIAAIEPEPPADPLAERSIDLATNSMQDTMNEASRLTNEASRLTTVRQTVAQNLQLAVDCIDRLTQLAAVELQVNQQLPQCDRASQIYQLLKPYDLPLLSLVAARGSRPIRRAIWHYLTQLAAVKPLLTGHDLKTLGYKPGKLFKEILETLQAATLDGVITDRPAAIGYLQTHYPLTSSSQTS
ncbi:CBS domain-containing protein [Alkalinema sp. FACHB-956]|uniref:CBS domain-containing protein n=1 Tax=Alkalinema sp. FACHB-956 TaxID=2692768 RepID=UPI0016843FCD|nr:CBS domain-containing protein [Alkalinema sp. FACHB-956]MBD2329720.1 CBS domain-containing protein [Alkalinema sp. FACHB-956]